jgi:SAM-dependent methyltransferase
VEQITRDWDYWAYLFRVTHRESIAGIAEYDERLIAFIMAALELQPGDELLDLACGSGVHGVRLGKEGLGVTGVAFIVGDMREPPCAGTFDAVTILSQSFGFFGPPDDLTVLRAVRAALRPGSRFLLDLNESTELECSRKGWQELEGGFLLSEVHYDPLACVRTSTFQYIDRDGRLNVAQEPERIRIYTLPELEGMIAATGLELEAVYGSMALPLVPYSADCHERRLVVGRRGA